MSEKIDWSKAPEGATHYYPSTEECYLAGYGCAPLVWTGMWCKAFQFAQREHKCIKRPSTPSWSGEGLPPVGVVCEALWTSATGEYVRVIVVGYDHDQSYAVYRILAGVRAGEYESSRPGDVEGHPCFRLTRTPEQIAADEREAAILDMERICRGGNFGSGWLSALYDAGYRKP